MKMFSGLKPGLALAVSVVVLVLLTGIISDWGKWYAPQNVYMAQTLAMMRGEFALSRNPEDIGRDMVWNDGGVQQVWGLGVPLILLPFYIGSKLFGFHTFPDRIVFVFLLFVTALLLFYSFRDFFRSIPVHRPQAFAFFMSTAFIFFPPFVVLLKSRFVVYEETVGFLYLCTGLLFAFLIRLLNNKDGISFFALLFLAGFLPIVRPTGFFYALPAAGIALYSAWQYRFSFSKIFSGLVLFTAGITFLCVTNYFRFGGVAEFGHSLNVSTDLLSIELTRFPTDFFRAPLIDKLAETTGALFMGPASSTWNIFHIPAGAVVPFQLDAERWRSISFYVFDPFYFLFLIYCMLNPFLFKEPFREQFHLRAFYFFGFFSFFGLLGFYSLSPAIAGRYFVDFALSFFALVAGSISVFLVRFSYTKFRFPKYALALTVIACFVFELFSTSALLSRRKPIPAVLGKYQLLSVLRKSTGPSIPQSYSIEPDPVKDKQRLTTLAENNVKGDGYIPQKTNAAFNGTGWRYGTGKVSRTAIFFVSDPKSLVLILSTTGLSTDFLREHVRAKIGLEFLMLEEVTTNGAGTVTMRFGGPTREIYQNHIQVAFIDFTAPAVEKGKNIFLQSMTWN